MLHAAAAIATYRARHTQYQKQETHRIEDSQNKTTKKKEDIVAEALVKHILCARIQLLVDYPVDRYDKRDFAYGIFVKRTNTIFRNFRSVRATYMRTKQFKINLVNSFISKIEVVEVRATIFGEKPIFSRLVNISNHIFFLFVL